MKKTILSALAVVAMVSCSKSDETSFTQTDAEVRISSSIATRTIANTWEAGDQIGVYMTTNGSETKFDLGTNVLYTTVKTDGAFASTTPLYFPSSGSVDLLAYYPYVAGTTETPFAITSYPVSVATQTDQGAIDLMKSEVTGQSKSADAVVMKFDHKLSRIALTIKNGGGVTESELEGLVVTLSGTKTTATYDLPATSTPIAFDSETAAADITMLTAANGQSAEAIVIPQSDLSATLTFTTTDNTYSAAITTTEFVIGQEYNYTVTVNNTGISISSPTINGWDSDTNDTDNTLVASPVATVD
ncbi:MAG: fimbrillin family protein [Rikenellaceae bacterium]